jgi:hypothetical protein
MKSFRVFLAVAALAVTASGASAQVVEEARVGIRRSMVSSNPIGLLFEWYNGEFERALNSTTSLAIAGSTFSDLDVDDDVSYAAVDGIIRYYPSARALNGFSIGGSIGLVNFDDDYDCTEIDIEFGCEDNVGTAATIGVRGDYVWILGRDQHFSVATGIGARRVLGGDLDTEFLPIGRLSIGYAW